jgi:hypothetical protein
MYERSLTRKRAGRGAPCVQGDMKVLQGTMHSLRQLSLDERRRAWRVTR